jgi:hypothetical protein
MDFVTCNELYNAFLFWRLDDRINKKNTLAFNILGSGVGFYNDNWV